MGIGTARLLDDRRYRPAGGRNRTAPHAPRRASQPPCSRAPGPTAATYPGQDRHLIRVSPGSPAARMAVSSPGTVTRASPTRPKPRDTASATRSCHLRTARRSSRNGSPGTAPVVPLRIVNGTTSAVRRRAARRRSETGTETAAFGYVEQLGFRNGGSLSGGAVGPFSEQVRVSRVAGGRFDEVERDPGHRERLTVLQGSDRLRLAVRLLAGSCWALEVNTGGSGAVRVSRLVGSRAGTCRISLPWSARRHPRTKLPRRARAGAGPPRRAARHRCRA